MANTAYIALADGQVFEGKSFGAVGSITGELVFTTGMANYIEALTDPNYYGQILIHTFPLIGNYGIIPADFERSAPQLSGCIVRENCGQPSNFRCEQTLEKFLIEQNIIGVCGLDTRTLTKIIRESGPMNARLLSGADAQKFETLTKAQFTALIKEIGSFYIRHAVQKAGSLALTHTLSVLLEKNRGQGKKVVLWDFGARESILRKLLKRNFDIILMPASATAKDILAQKPDGIVLSNGPGDPLENIGPIAELKKLCGAKKSNGSIIPIFGICLGHQLLALAMGAKTEKLTYGHRGVNQPVKQISSGRLFITDQNHGYAIVTKTLPRGAKPSFININDNSCEGIEYPKINAFSVQFFPETFCGPLDTGFLFDDFTERVCL